MDFKFFIVLLLCSIMPLSAQTSGSVSGKVTDKISNQPLPYVNIVVKENGTVVNGGITDDNGIFSIKKLPLKTYQVEVQFMGYKTLTANANLNEANKDANLGILTITVEATTLEEVNIVKETSTIEQKIDRKVITLGKDLTTAGGTASEIMNNIPSVNVDQDGKISLRGNQNVRVLVDGRPTNIDPAQLLKQIPSSSIKKIELITNPSAKYNPEGMSGIINIILNKNANDGFNGSLNAGINFGETPKFNNSLDVNYRVGKVNFFANAGSNFGQNAMGGPISRIDDIKSTQNIDLVNDNESYLGKFGMDYYINDHNTLSAYTNQNHFTGKGNVSTSIMYAPGTPEGFDSIEQLNHNNSNNRNNTYNLAFRHKFEKEDHTLDFEGNYNDSRSTQEVNYNTMTNGGTPSRYVDNVTDKRENTTLNLDYINPLDDKTTLELGAEARLIRSDNAYITTNLLIATPALRNSVYAYDMDIYSAYATFGQKLGKFSYQVGARFEHFKADANFNEGETTYQNKYLTLYPSAYLTYNLDDTNIFQLSYSRRVDRPSLEQTKPIREFSTPQVTSLGNQFLNPQFTNSVEINYTKMFGEGSSVTGGVFYRLISDEINRVIYPDQNTENTQDLIMSYDNFDSNSAFGLEMSANYKINAWWDLQPAVDFSSIKQQGTVARQLDVAGEEFEFRNTKITASAFNARVNSNFKVNSRLSFLLFGFYRSPVDGVQNNSIEMYKVDSGARYSLLDNKMTLSVRFNDMFKTQRYGFNATNPYPQVGAFRWESRTVYFGLNYIFGGGKSSEMSRKQREDNTKQGGGGMF